MTEGNGEARKIPQGWCWIDLGEILDCIEAGKSFRCEERPPRNHEVGVAKVSAVTWGEYNELESKTCKDASRVENKFLIRTGDFLFSRANTIELVGACVIARKVDLKVMLSDKTLRLKFFKDLNEKYILYFLRCKYGRSEIKRLATGNQESMRNIGQDRIKAIRMPFPPINEQNRIIEKIEELFSDLDQGIESLKTAQKQLKVYRQAVLKWAFEGKLTEEWRRQRSSTLKTGEVLLAQIKAERENRYQQQVAEWEEKVKEWEAIGKVGKKPTKPQKLKELPALTESELDDLPKIPNGWYWVRYGSICSEIRNGISQKPDSDHGEKIFRISAVRPFFIDLQDFRYIDNSDHRYEDFLLENNEILFTRYNGSRRYVGVCAKFNSNERFLYPDKLIRTRLFSCELTIPDYIVYAANVGGSREYLDKRIRTTAGQSGVSGEDIKLTPVPVCSIEEQEQIIQEIESRLSICDQLETTIIENLQKAEALRQSILKQAFEGKLVPQDPNDEPAEKLLERIKAEREATQPKTSKQLKIKGL